MPSHMEPRRIVITAAMPLTRSGKLNRKAVALFVANQEQVGGAVSSGAAGDMAKAAALGLTAAERGLARCIGRVWAGPVARSN